MRWQGRRQSDNVEDQRGAQGGGIGGGFGRGGALAVPAFESFAVAAFPVFSFWW